MSTNSDLEKSLATETVTPQPDVAAGVVEHIGEYNPEVNHLHGADWLSHKLKKIGVEVEDRGIERVPPDNRTHTRPFDLMLLWGSANVSITNFSVGLLGPAVFGLGLTDSCLTILFFLLFSNSFVSYLATFGPKTGLRQLTVSRYSFGWYGNKVMAFLQSVSCVGWSAVNATVAGQTLASLSNNKLPQPAGIVLIAFATWFVAMVGYKYVHLYERYQWIPVVIVYFILLGEGAKHFSSTPMPSGSYEAGNVLTFGCVLVGGALGWAPFASDYDVNMPEDTNPYAIFAYTFIGLTVPSTLLMSMGAAFGSSLATNPTWQAGYDLNSMGGVFGAALAPLNGFGTFIMIILALSIIGGNLPNSYSLALAFQAVHPWFIKVPRWLWTTVGTIVYIAIGIAASYDFAEALSTFMAILSYYLAMYTTILLEEHFIFRKSKFHNYNLEAWNDKHKLPWGVASMVAFCFGIMAIVLGMAQTWYIGVIGRQIGDPAYGGDIAFELAAAFVGIIYPIGRILEKKYRGFY